MIAAVVAAASFATMPEFVAVVACKKSSQGTKYFKTAKKSRKDKSKLKSENGRKRTDLKKAQGNILNKDKAEVKDNILDKDKAEVKDNILDKDKAEVKDNILDKDKVEVQGNILYKDKVEVEDEDLVKYKQLEGLVNQLFATFDKEQQFKDNIIDIIDKLIHSESLYDKKLSIAKFIYNRITAGKSPYVNNFQQVLRLLARCCFDKDNKAVDYVRECLHFMLSGESKCGIKLNSNAVVEIINSLYQCDDGEYFSIAISMVLLLEEYHFLRYVNEDGVDAILNLFLKNLCCDTSCLNKKITARRLMIMAIAKKMKNKNFFVNISQDQISKMLDIFDHILDQNFCNIIENKLYINWFMIFIDQLITDDGLKNCSRDNILKLKDILFKNKYYNKQSKDFLIIIKNLILNNYLEKCSKEELSEILNALLEALDSGDSISYFAYVMEHLLKQGFLKGYPEAEMINLADRLTYAFENENVRNHYLAIITCLLDGGFLKNCNGNDLSKIIIAISRCSGSETSRQNCAALVEKLANSGILGSLNGNGLLRIKNILNNCLNDENAKEYVANIAKILINHGFFQKTSSEIVQIINILLKCSENKLAESHILSSIEKLISNNCFLIYPKDRVFDVTDLLQKYHKAYYSKYNDENGVPRMIIDSDQTRDENIMYRIKMAIYNINEQAGFGNESLFNESLRRQQEGI